MTTAHNFLLLRRRICWLVAVLLVAVAAPSTVTAAATSNDGESVVAWFEGRWIRLTDGWGEARACIGDDRGARCYRSEAELDKAEGLEGSGEFAPMADCTTGVRLYENTTYNEDVSGRMLLLTPRFVLHNLSSWSFNNITSSYKIGACSAAFYDTTSGSGLYPGNTNAWVSASAMWSGWDNRIGSVYIN